MAKVVCWLRTTILVLLSIQIIQVVVSQTPAPNEKPPIETEPDDPWYGQPIPPQPRPGYYKFLGDCIDGLTRKCGKEIAHYIFENKEVDRPCCQNLQKMGQLCSKSLSFTLTQFPKFVSQAALIIQKSDELFNKCAKL